MPPPVVVVVVRWLKRLDAGLGGFVLPPLMGTVAGGLLLPGDLPKPSRPSISSSDLLLLDGNDMTLRSDWGLLGTLIAPVCFFSLRLCS
jgi:hypothetical protein